MASIFTLWNTVEEATLMKLSKKQTRKSGGRYKWVSERIKLLFKSPDCWTRLSVPVCLRASVHMCLCVCVCEYTYFCLWFFFFLLTKPRKSSTAAMCNPFCFYCSK